MATFVQNGDKVRITIGSSTYDYNLREVDYAHNGTTITVETDGYTRHNIAYLDVTSPSSTDIQDLVDQLNAFKVSISTNGGADSVSLNNIDLNTLNSKQLLQTLIELQIETNNLLKLILS